MKYPWEAASTSHLIYAMADAELIAAIAEACAVPRSVHYLDHLRLTTQHRRSRMPAEMNREALVAIGAAEREAGRRSL